MTLVTVLSDSTKSVMLADSRLSWPNEMFGDVCQKVTPVGDDGLIAFAGDVKTAATVLKAIIATSDQRGNSWLKYDKEVYALFDAVGVGPSDPAASFLVTFTDRGHIVLAEHSVPGAAIIQFSTRRQSFSRNYRPGMRMIGKGAAVMDEISKDPGWLAIWGFGGNWSTHLAMAQSSMFFAEVLYGTAVSQGIKSVGGLFQIYFQTPAGVFTVPYKRWVDLGEGLGTYVEMKFLDGKWVQAHNPTGLRVALETPWQANIEQRGKANQVFDMGDYLEKDSPGVIPAANPNEIYRALDILQQVVVRPASYRPE